MFCPHRAQFCPALYVRSGRNNYGIGDEGLTRLAASLPRLRSLLTLSLNGNPFSAHGIRCLELKIDQMPALRELSIMEIPVTDVAADALVLQAQRALRETLLRSVASRPQSVAKTMGAHVQLYSFLLSKFLVLRPKAMVSIWLTAKIVTLLVVSLVATMA